MGDEIHMGGLVSGTDVQGIIDKLLALQAKPMEKLEEEIEGYGADITAWTDISADMSALTDVLDDLRSWDTWNQMTATSSDVTKLTAIATSAAMAATYDITITQLAKAHAVGSERASILSPGATATTDLVAAGVLTAGDQFIIEGQTITIDATESLSTLRTKINTASSSMPSNNRVTATLLDDRLVLTRNNTGATDIAMTESTGSPLQALGILDGGGSYQNELVTARDAIFTVNGATVTRSSNTGLTDVIENVTLNLKGEADAADNLQLTIERDTETPKTAILDFIEKYNAVTTKLKQYGTINLVGDNPRGADVDSVGELANDSLLKSIDRNMRKQATDSKYPYLNPINAGYTYNGMTGICDSLDDVGIWTSGKENMLSLTDEDRLDYMLENNFEKIAQLFRGVYDDEVGYTHGVATDFYNYAYSVTDAISGEIDRRIARLDEQSDDAFERLEKMEADLDAYETRLWAQFTAMENAVAELQSDLSYLTSKLDV